AGIAPTSSLYPPISPRSFCPPTHPSSTPSSAFGSICASAFSRTACGQPTTTSSTPAAAPGPQSAPKPAGSARYAATIGQRSSLSVDGIRGQLLSNSRRLNEPFGTRPALGHSL